MGRNRLDQIRHWLVAYTAIIKFTLSASQNYCQQEAFRVRSRRQKCSWSRVKKETLQASFGEVSLVKYLLICKFLFRKHLWGCSRHFRGHQHRKVPKRSPGTTFGAFVGNCTPTKCLASRASPVPSLESSRARPDCGKGGQPAELTFSAKWSSRRQTSNFPACSKWA